MPEHLVSICLPTYNRPLTLKRTLNSLVNQTYKFLEIIVSDNCSPNPEVFNVVKEYLGDARIKYFRHDTNKGPIYNFNFVLGKVTGDFFMKIADDDWIDHNYVELCLTFLLKNPDYAAAYGKARIYSKTGEYKWDDVKIDMANNNAKERVKQYLRNVKYNSTYYALMRTEHLSHVFSENVLAMDWIIVSRVAFIGKFKLLNDTQTHISEGGDSISTENVINAYNMSKFIRRFPYFSLCVNVYSDILYRSSVYKKIGFIKRQQFAFQCQQVIFSKFRVIREFKYPIKNFIKNGAMAVVNIFKSKKMIVI